MNRIAVLGRMFQSPNQFVILKGFHMLDPGGLWSWFVYLIWFRIMRTNLRAGPWGIFCRVRVSVHWEGEIYPECGWYHILGQGLRLNAKEKFIWAQHVLLSASWLHLPCDQLLQAHAINPFLWCTKLYAKINPSTLPCFPSYILSHSKKKKTNAHLKIAKKKYTKTCKSNSKSRTNSWRW